MSGTFPQSVVTASKQSSVVYLDVNLDYGLNVNQITVSNTDAITVKIVNILYTFIGSRPFEPEFGSIVPTLIFTGILPNGKQAYRITTAIYTALSRWLEGIINLSLGGINVIPVPSQTCYFIVINYTIAATGKPSSLNLRYNQ